LRQFSAFASSSLSAFAEYRPRVLTRFAVDALDVPTWKLRELPGENLHVMGEFDLGPRPVLTFTSQA